MQSDDGKLNKNLSLEDPRDLAMVQSSQYDLPVDISRQSQVL